ncbi:hypothetical protein R1sor_003611 [Riccia sorocarpa]|uniref:Uncharacterized protein n=1 Tax=Riccia sorocarpa TaxID=122646 RepID=A0ABD3H4Z0_9MARC
MKQTRLYFDDLAARLKTKFQISRVWFISLNVADATLIIWKHSDPDPVKCGILLKCISNTSKILEVMAMKDGGTFVRLTLEPKNMDRKTSKIALEGDLMSEKDSQCIKRALSSRVFGVLQKDAATYLPHPEAASSAVPRKPSAVVVETDSDEEREIARDIKASQRHEAERIAEAKAAKAAKSAVDKKGKAVVQEAPKKKRTDSTQAPREKLLGSTMVAEKARLSGESNTETGKCKRESQVTCPPPPRNPVTEETSEEEDIPSDKEQGDATDSGSDTPLQSQPVNKKGSKLKTLKKMDKSPIDKEKQDIRRKAVERCSVSAVPIVIPLE